MLKVLYVDDYSDLLEIAKIFLENINPSLTVFTVISPLEALAALEKEEFDVIVSDYQMPEMDGLEFLKILRERGDTRPFIIFTGKGREEVAIEALNLGADGYVRKGIDTKSQYSVLNNIITQIFGRKEAEKALEKSELQYQMVVENVGVGISFADPEENIIFANSLAEDLFGVPHGELVGKNLKEFVSPETFEVVSKQTEERQKGIQNSYEFEIIKLDGSKCEILLIATPCFDNNGEFAGAFGVFRDITLQKRAKIQEISYQAILFKTLKDNVQTMTYILDFWHTQCLVDHHPFIDQVQTAIHQSLETIEKLS